MIVRLASVLTTVAVVLLGVWVTGGLLTDDFEVSVALTTVFFVLAGTGALVLARARRDLGVPILVTFVAASMRSAATSHTRPSSTRP